MKTVENAISCSAGRFFGLYTKGGVFNARLITESPKTYVVEDRNTGREFRVNKASIKGVKIGGRRFGQTA